MKGEQIHVADASGKECERCGADLLGEWLRGERVAIKSGDAWHTARQATCDRNGDAA